MSWPSMKIRPDVGCSNPASMRSSVVLPQPDPPSSENSLPLCNVERDVVDGLEGAERLGNSLDPDEWCRGYTGICCGHAPPRLGSPAAQGRAFVFNRS